MRGTDLVITSRGPRGPGPRPTHRGYRVLGHRHVTTGLQRMGRGDNGNDWPVLCDLYDVKTVVPRFHKPYVRKKWRSRYADENAMQVTPKQLGPFLKPKGATRISRT